MYKISKQFSFSASHILEGLPQEHPCSRLHGHNYVVTVHLRAGQLNSAGFVKDYRELDGVKKYIDSTLDHRHLNDVLPFNPTAENMAKYLYDVFVKDIPELYAVEVSETPKTTAIYEADGK
jgi:6-pyruvoyltetrahydropterin/6-carboxytetrahydropterin synthase